MPCKKPVHPLTKLCLHNIAVHFDSLWCRVDKKQDWDMAYDLGPFVNLPGNLLYELIEYLKRRNFLRRHHLHYLIQSKIEKLNLSTGIGDIYFALRFVVDRCKRLRCLDLSTHCDIQVEALNQTLRCLSELWELNLHKTLCNDSTLMEIGRHCKELHSLDVSFCNVTSEGLKLLCRHPDHPKRLQCQKLMQLSVLQTHVSRIGAALVLRSLPNLMDFEYEGLHLTLWDLMESDMPQRIYNLTRVCTIEPVTPTCLLALVKLCPRLRQLSFLHSELLYSSVTELGKLELLTELSLGNGRGVALTFDGGIKPFLKLRGSQLQKLHLHGLVWVDIEEIDRLCPHLNHIGLSNISRYVPVTFTIWENKFFRSLSRVDLSASKDTDIPQSVIQRLIAEKPLLEEIRLKRCRDATDIMLCRFLPFNRKIKTLRFEQCNLVTSKLLLHMLLTENHLEKLTVWACSSVNQTDYEQMLNVIKRYNLSVNIDYLAPLPMKR